MSMLTAAIGAAKKAKHALKDEIDRRTPVYLSPVRRIEQVRTTQRVCAMTFDDGPMLLPPSPCPDGVPADHPLTAHLLDVLDAYGAKGTFDVVGDTSTNYPDQAGQAGSASWGGIAYDHYPDFGRDDQGGAVHCPELIDRMIRTGHQITNHTYAHVLFGKKSVVYGRRHHLHALEEVTADLHRLDDLLRQKHGYAMGFMRPPHYVDRISGGFDSYDACALLGYQYMAASFDGAGWLPCKTYEQEVEAMWKPIEAALQKDPDAFCGQIIFQKDGYNMARRTPVADGLGKALEVLKRYGYRVVTVQELLEYSPFADLGLADPRFPAARGLLERGYTVAFRNNKVLPQTPLTRGALAMLRFGADGARRRIELMQGKKAFAVRDMKASHPYSGAVSLALERDVFSLDHGRFRPDAPVGRDGLESFCRALYGRTPDGLPENPTHGDTIRALAAMEDLL